MIGAALPPELQREYRYTKMTGRVFPLGQHYTETWMDLAEEGARQWGLMKHKQFGSMAGWSLANSVSFDKVVASLDPKYSQAMSLMLLLSYINAGGLREWVESGHGKYIVEIISLLRLIPGDDVMAFRYLLETIEPYVETDPLMGSAWILDRHEDNQFCYEMEVGLDSAGQAVYQTVSDEPVYTCEIWSRLDGLTEQARKLEFLIPQIGAWFDVTYGVV